MLQIVVVTLLLLLLLLLLLTKKAQRKIIPYSFSKVEANVIVRFSLEGCAADKWQCANGPCIYLLSRCDSFLDCFDGSDERACHIIDICSEGRRACANGQCIPGRLFCDGTVNCFDGSDERCGPDGRKGTPASPTNKRHLTVAPAPLPVPPKKRATVRHVEEDSPEVEAVISETTTQMMTTPITTTSIAPTSTITPTTTTLPTTTTTTITTPMTTKTPAATTTSTTATTEPKAAAVPFWLGLTAGTTSPIPKTTTPSHVNCIRVEDYVLGILPE
ncbi:VLDLR-like protein [Mya arenaria]|uniref:VLDLR-like protein n=1 Tax=Mya arenaria TaxID=6604 RepID=A0ABY7DKM1_MYAAR|nr:VLDLR-like protein [Mya arenaria]